MSASEWLHFINPLIVIMLAIALIASAPIIKTWREEDGLSDELLAWKKTLIGAFAFIALGWMLAWLATHIATPFICVNVLAISKLILTLALIVTGLIVLHRIFQRNNTLSLAFILAKKYLPPFIEILGFIVSAIALLFIKSFNDETFEKDIKKNLSDEDKALKLTYANDRGEYCDENKMNWY